MIRTAISPRLAIRTRLNINLPCRIYTESTRSELIAPRPGLLRLQWNISMLARRILFTLVLQCSQRAHQPGTRIARHDHFIDITKLGGLERIGESLAIVLDQLRAFRGLQFVTVQNIDRLL